MSNTSPLTWIPLSCALNCHLHVVQEYRYKADFNRELSFFCFFVRLLSSEEKRDASPSPLLRLHRWVGLPPLFCDDSHVTVMPGIPKQVRMRQERMRKANFAGRAQPAQSVADHRSNCSPQKQHCNEGLLPCSCASCLPGACKG